MKKFVKKYLSIIIVLFIFLFLFVCDNAGLRGGAKIMDNLKSIATSFTPTTDLFDDGSEVSFVSYFFGVTPTGNTSEAPKFYKPSMVEVEVKDGVYTYSYTGVIKSVASGKVSAEGYLENGEKYIEISHNLGYVSRFEGVEVLGVATGENVKAGSPIGVCQGEFTFKLMQNGEVVKEINWEN